MDAFSSGAYEAIRRHISLFFRSLDERVFDEQWARAFFTDDIRAVTPLGTADGIDAVRRDTATAIGRFARTQHVSTDVLTDLTAGGREAEAGWNAVMIHVHSEETLRARGVGAPPVFTVGGRCTARLVRTDDGWRFARTTIEPLWTTGEPPVLD
ncbi:nuclear transport factor 2 family protein [Actinacidiphila alni]|uniref:nuclear transport factor 2 family protein n=1 Tax=Actinacidiphila alni TaxID=380248 RepID=UPI003456FDF7